jgi:hypothetical protein
MSQLCEFNFLEQEAQGLVVSVRALFVRLALDDEFTLGDLANWLWLW